VKIDIMKYNLLLANKGISVKELATQSGVNAVTLCRIKNGAQDARPQTLGKVAKALQCKVEDFIQD
jgi:DNA-binding Xre family transcriptional regulator